MSVPTEYVFLPFKKLIIFTAVSSSFLMSFSTTTTSLFVEANNGFDERFGFTMSIARGVVGGEEEVFAVDTVVMGAADGVDTDEVLSVVWGTVEITGLSSDVGGTEGWGFGVGLKVAAGGCTVYCLNASIVPKNTS